MDNNLTERDVAAMFDRIVIDTYENIDTLEKRYVVTEEYFIHFFKNSNPDTYLMEKYNFVLKNRIIIPKELCPIKNSKVNFFYENWTEDWDLQEEADIIALETLRNTLENTATHNNKNELQEAFEDIGWNIINSN